MILVDTSIWIDHLRAGVPRLSELLNEAAVLIHPWVLGELALGQLSRRVEILDLLGHLPAAQVATDVEVLNLIQTRHLYGIGIGYVDAHLLASTLLTTGSALWTGDKRLTGAAAQLAIAYRLAP